MVKYYKNENSWIDAMRAFKWSIRETEKIFPVEVINKIIIEYDDEMLDKLVEKGDIAGGFILISKNYDKFKITFDPNYIAWRMEEYGRDATWEFVWKLVRHEFFHAYQYTWLIKHGGAVAIKRYFDYAKRTSYEKNIVEIGAMQFENIDHPRVQKLSKDLSIFIK